MGDNMPEIAEVETVRNTLKKRILNKKIKDIDIRYSKIIDNDIKDFKNKLINNEFIDILRKGKWLIFELHDYYLLSHLRMEGKYFIKNNNDIINKHEHIIIKFNDNTELRYHDTRKFGKMKVISKEELLETEEIKKQGKEPFDNDLTSDYLINKFNNKNIAIKTVLLDQTIISGLGNIYADEVLYESKINPLRKAKTLSKIECDNIINSSKKIIKKAIIEGGTTIKSYTSSLGVIGNYQNYLKVHKKENSICNRCNNKIIKIKINGRSTYYCKGCQK